MKTLFAILLMLVSAGYGLMAQKISVVSATEEKFSGGVVGRHGANYRIALKTNTFKMVFDSVYINGIGYSITPPTAGSIGLYIDSVKHTYNITVGEMHDREIPGRPGDKDKANPSVAHVRSFTGKALFVYKYKGKKHLFLVKEISELPPKMYP